MNNQDFLDLEVGYCLAPQLEARLVMQKAKGSRLWDADGNSFLDLSAGWRGAILGYTPSLLQQVVKDLPLQSGFSPKEWSFDRLGPAAKKLAEWLLCAQVLPFASLQEGWQLLHQFAQDKSQSEAPMISYWTTQGTSWPHAQSISFESLKEAIPSATVIVIDPIDWSSSTLLLDQEILHLHVKNARRTGAYVILDHSKLPYGYLTQAMLYNLWGELTWDGILLGSWLTGATLPFGILALKEKWHAPSGENFFYPLSLVLALECLCWLEERFVAPAALERGQKLAELYNSLPWVKAVRGEGLLQVVQTSAQVESATWQSSGLLIQSLAPQTFLSAPALEISDADWESMTTQIAGLSQPVLD